MNAILTNHLQILSKFGAAATDVSAIVAECSAKAVKFQGVNVISTWTHLTVLFLFKSFAIPNQFVCS